ncbi:hypothetical protein U2F26_30850 [Micromonospora sp. 4G57]|uniref:Uncharacterized protein n=1 Tax=Micromonospora sicca TaxID=2202420 RepID=A0ABU5JKA5_9ACTN|nr:MULTISPECIES: hypothetical protein [unclassified Micromonospora]MDZ5447068.1 hypothetical protein [Micromonospora sp. 4G57]MDZ5493055.1 hypothetical protein [Micromonospora sp. 4G53]
MTGPRPEWCEQTCAVCPAQELGPGQFDVVDRPGPEFAYDKDIGWRVAPSGTAVCVHPYRVGLPPGRYASAGEPLAVESARPAPTAAALELPTEVVDLEGWLVAVLRNADPDAIFTAVARAERLAGERFDPRQVVAAMRRVLSVELANR